MTDLPKHVLEAIETSRANGGERVHVWMDDLTVHECARSIRAQTGWFVGIVGGSGENHINGWCADTRPGEAAWRLQVTLGVEPPVKAAAGELLDALNGAVTILKEIMPQMGKLFIQDFGLLNDVLIAHRKIHHALGYTGTTAAVAKATEGQE